MTKKIVDTVVFLMRIDAFLLGMKKRGTGAGKWNGYGGKVEVGETVRHAVIRELYEECRVRANEQDLRKVGVITFHVPDEIILETHVFLLYEWEGEPQETEEMRPYWFGYNETPFDAMWAADRTWLPMAIKQDRFYGDVWYSTDDDVEQQVYRPASKEELEAMEEIQ